MYPRHENVAIAGTLTTPTLAVLQAQAAQARKKLKGQGVLRVRETCIDVSVLHADPLNEGALFQVAKPPQICHFRLFFEFPENILMLLAFVANCSHFGIWWRGTFEMRFCGIYKVQIKISLDGNYFYVYIVVSI